MEIFFQCIFVSLILFAYVMIFIPLIGSALALIFTAILITIYFRIPKAWISNVVTIWGLVAMGTVFGFSILPWDVVIILVVMAIYDIIAVYKTRFLVDFTQKLIRCNLFLGLIISRERFFDFGANLEEVKSDILSGLSEKRKPLKFSFFGFGDFFFPLLLAVSVLDHYGSLASLIIAGFSTVGFGLSWFLFVFKKELPFPALPLIVLFAIVGYLITSPF